MVCRAEADEEENDQQADQRDEHGRKHGKLSELAHEETQKDPTDRGNDGKQARDPRGALREVCDRD